jgi:hypothetical protein
MSYTKWTNPKAEKRLKEAVKNNKSIAGVLQELGLIAAGGNYKNIQKHIARLNLDTSHFTGQAHMSDYFNLNPKTTASIKRTLIELHGHICLKCLNTTWQGQLIPLELEHIDGNNNNNSWSNLTLLCCNCHALTDTWRRKKPLS